MNKPKPEQIKQIEKLVGDSWEESCDKISHEDMEKLMFRMQTEPDLIQETQDRLMAAGFACFNHNEIEFANTLKKAGFILAAFKVNAENLKSKGVKQ